MKCGLLGRKLGHSYSPAIHALLGDYEYALFEKEPEELEHFLRHGDWDGINVTIPYKQSVIPYLDCLSEPAQQLGAVNTIIRRDGKLIGHNTDYEGFHSMVAKFGINPSGKECLVLGSGGASKVCTAVMRELGANVTVISRCGQNHYGNLHLYSHANILVNATPVGMYPNTGISPVDLSGFSKMEGVLDVIYNPQRTQLIMDAENRGIPCMNGLWMLVAQAKCAAEWFTGTPIPSQKIQQVYDWLMRNMENIVLIGMPGCGKSTVGQLLAELSGKRFVDTDAQIELLTNRSVQRILAEDGEAAFRTWESKVLSEFGKQSGLIIATGGGCVTLECNYPFLHQNGCIYWLQRDLSLLATQGRPLSKNLEDMYRVRFAYYRRFADITILNNETPEEAAQKIWDLHPSENQG